jgi:DNA-binding transcriptional ArsR family regulator
MVTHRARSAPHADPFRAVGDATRRKILLSLLDKPAPVYEIAEQFHVTRPAISRHLRVLKDAGLVRQEKAGREIVYHLEPRALAEVREWLDAFWNQGLMKLKKSAEGRKR